MGKGRQIAGLVYEHLRSSGRRALWVSVSTDLKFDAERDLKDLKISPEVKVWPRGATSMPTGNLDKVAKEGVMFCTYSLLIHGSGKVSELGARGAAVDPQDLIKPGSRLKQLVDWLDKDPYGPLLVFDECHKAGHCAPGPVFKPPCFTA